MIDTTSGLGELVPNIFSALAQFERRLIQECAEAGLAAASARGRGSPRCIAFSPIDQDLLATGSLDNTIKLWSRAGKDYAEVATLKGLTASVHRVKFSSDGESLFSSAGDRTVKVWDVNTLQE